MTPVYLSALICIIGLLVFMLSPNPRPQEVGRIMFFVGLLAFLMGPGATLLFGR